MHARAGLYVGTQVGNRWWRRYSQGLFLARGNGHLWTDEQGVFFHRYLTADPLLIPWSQVLSIESGAFHAGRWAWGYPIFKVRWQVDGEALSSGFMVAGRRASQLETRGELRRELTARVPGTRRESEPSGGA